MRIAIARLMAGLQRMHLRARSRGFGSVGLLGSIALLLLSPGYSVAARLSPQAGGPAFQVKDINTQADSSVGSSPSQLVQIGSVVYFTAHDQATGQELWKSDGTAAGTVLVKDINPGQLDSSPRDFVDVNGIVFFTADDGRTNRELWKSDGSAAGTVLVRDIAPGELLGSNPNSLVNRGGTLFFFAFDGILNAALWKSDGTTAGTVLVKDMSPDDSSASDLTNVNGMLFFVTQNQLWKSDGTPDGTVQLTNNSLLSLESLTVVNGTLFFMGLDSTHGKELWKSDGTAAGTSLAVDVLPGAEGSEPRQLFNFNGTLFFVALYQLASSSFTWALWSSDGVSATRVTPDGVSTDSLIIDGQMAELNGALFFRAFEQQSGYELWKTTGTPGGTTLVKDIEPGVNGADPGNLTNINGTLFFTTRGSSIGNQAQLWKSDGTIIGTLLVKEFDSMEFLDLPGNLTNLNGTLLFAANDQSHGRELWHSDGSADGTTLLKDLAVAVAGSSAPSQLVNVRGTLFFTANRSELWKSDGSAAGTVLVMGGLSSISLLIDVNGTLFFTSGFSLWKSDGTTAGTVLLKSDVYFAGSRANVNGTLFFASANELWKSDGTAAGTVLVRRFGPPSSGFFVINDMISRNGVLFLNIIINCNCEPDVATMHARLAEVADKTGLWRSDGTAAGTTLIKETLITSWIDRGDALFFVAGSVIDGRAYYDMWRSDGTPGGTVMIKALPAASQLTNANGRIFFISDDNLWISDGTPENTIPIKQLGFNTSCPAGKLTPRYDTVFFMAYDPTNGCELWKSDGTGAGTVPVQDIAPSALSAYPKNMASIAGSVFFTANDRQAGWELWQSKGTPADTVMLQEIAPGPGYSSPDQFTLAGKYIYFVADDGSTGRELWAMPINLFLNPTTRIPLTRR